MNWRDLFAIFTVRRCQCCGEILVAGEDTICLRCHASVLTRLYCCSAADTSPIRHRLAVRSLGIIAVMASYGQGTAVSRLIRKGKYHDRPDLILLLARSFARTLVSSGILDGIDAIQPMPMRPMRQMRRGYNQAELIAREISAAASIPLIDALVMTHRHKPQARRDAARRMENIKGSFALRDGSDVAGKHIALVDDIITTGATMSEALETLGTAAPGRLSVIALAATAVQV